MFDLVIDKIRKDGFINANEVMPLIIKYYEKDGNICGGALHTVLDDDNLENHFIESCINFAREKGDIDGVILGELLLFVPFEQRDNLSIYK
jgi:hypothetical protein